MSTLKDRTNELLASAKALDAKDIRRRLRFLGWSLIRMNRQYRGMGRAVLEMEKRDALREKELCDLRAKFDVLEARHGRV